MKEKILISLINKVENGEMSFASFSSKVEAMAKNRSASLLKLFGLMTTFWVHFLRENFWSGESKRNLYDLKNFVKDIKESNKKKGEPNKFWFKEKDLQEFAEDFLDDGILKLKKKYKNNPKVNELFKGINNRDQPKQFKENKLWDKGFKFSTFDKDFYTKW